MPRFRVEMRQGDRWVLLGPAEGENEEAAEGAIRAALPKRTEGMRLRALPLPPKRTIHEGARDVR